MLGFSQGWPARLAVLAAIVASTQACSGTRDPEPKATRVGSFEPGALIVAGHGDRVAAWGYTYGVEPRLAVYHQDPASRDLLVHDATLPGCDCNARHVTLNDQWIVAAGEKWVSYSPVTLAGFVQLAPASGPYTDARFLFPSGWSAVDRATAWGDRLVAVLGQAVRIYDITDLAAPALLDEFSMTGPSTAIEAAGGGVFVFTANGYAFVDLATSTLTESTVTAFAGVERAVAHGGKLRVGGASRYAGYYRVASFDPSGAPTLTVEADADQIPDQGANVGEMTFDAARGEYVVLRATNPFPMSGQGGVTEILRYAFDIQGAVTGRVTMLDKPSCLTGSCPTYLNVQPRTHANAGFLYAVLVEGPSDVPADIFRLP